MNGYKAIMFMGAAALSAITTSVAAHTTPKQWPHEGTLYFDGEDYVDANFKWHAVGGWAGRDRAVELDLQINSSFYESCTSWSTLPNPYSDCGTAGVSEPSGTRQFGVGSYIGENIRANTSYRAQWVLSGGYASNSGTPVRLQWQEAYRFFCPEYNPWCMNGYTGGLLHTSQVWKYAVPVTTSWYY